MSSSAANLAAYGLSCASRLLNARKKSFSQGPPTSGRTSASSIKTRSLGVELEKKSTSWAWTFGLVTLQSPRTVGGAVASVVRRHARGRLAPATGLGEAACCGRIAMACFGEEGAPTLAEACRAVSTTSLRCVVAVGVAAEEVEGGRRLTPAASIRISDARTITAAGARLGEAMLARPTPRLRCGEPPAEGASTDREAREARRRSEAHPREMSSQSA